MTKHVKWPYAIDPAGQGFFWPDSEQKRREMNAIRRNSPVQFESVYQASPGARQGVIFLEEYFRYYEAPRNLEIGIADEKVREFVNKGAFVLQAWDTAFSAEHDSDYTVCATAMVVPCQHYHCGEDPFLVGACEHHYDVYVLEIWRDKISWGEVAPAIKMLQLKWAPKVILIEKKGYGVAALEALENMGLPLLPVTPVQGKRSRAVDGVGAGSAQGWYRQHRVLHPSRATWLEAFETELKDFTGEKGNKDDQVDAIVHLLSHAITEGAAIGYVPEGWDSDEKIDMRMNTDPSNKLSLLFGLETGSMEEMAEIGLIDDPFADTCSRCRNFDASVSVCQLLGRRFSAITPACDRFEEIDSPTAKRNLW